MCKELSYQFICIFSLETNNLGSKDLNYYMLSFNQFYNYILINYILAGMYVNFFLVIT